MIGNDVRIAWAGLEFVGDGSEPLFVDALSGWLGLSGGSAQEQEPAGRHGSAVTAVEQSARTVTASGRLLTDTLLGRDALLDALDATMVPNRVESSVTAPLTVTIGGKTLTADAQLVNWAPVTEAASWRATGVPWRAQWRCPDPRKFGAQVSAQAPLTVQPVGTSLPRVMPFTMPDQPPGGRVQLRNPGTDPGGSPTVITLRGEQGGAVGVRNITTGARVSYAVYLAEDDVFVIDTALGGAWLNGVYRPPLFGSSVTRDLEAAPGVNTWEALGAAGSGSPSITVAVRPAHW